MLLSSTLKTEYAVCKHAQALLFMCVSMHMGFALYVCKPGKQNLAWNKILNFNHLND